MTHRRTVPLLAGAAVAAIVATPALAQRTARQVTPYIEASQVLTADLDGPNDVLTFTQLSAGVDASVQNERVSVQISYRYDHRIGWDDPVTQGSVHSGLARAAIQLSPAISLEGGALAARARDDIRGAAPGNLTGNVRNLSQLYSAYAGPTLVTQFDQTTVNAAYRFGYTKAEAPTADIAIPGQPVLDNYDASTNHMAMASIGTRAGTYLPVGLTLSGGWEREDISQLDQRYDGKFARIDTVVPLTPTLALTAGAGYENIRISARDAVVDAVTGAPVIDTNGRFVTDTASPRRLAYETDGLFWDAGVLWRPSARTSLEARVGRRYDTVSYTGSFAWAASARTNVNIGVYDSIDSIGRGLSDTLATLPTSFVSQPDPFGDQFSGCVFGDGQGAGSIPGVQAAGNCLTPLLGALTTASFRSRGIVGLVSTVSGPWSIGVGAGYANRSFLVPNRGPTAVLRGVRDDMYFGQVTLGRSFDARSALSADAYVTYFDSGLGGAPNVLGAGANTSYSYNFGRLGAIASLGIFAFDQDSVGSDVSGQALIGLRYSLR